MSDPTQSQPQDRDTGEVPSTKADLDVTNLLESSGLGQSSNSDLTTEFDSASGGHLTGSGSGEHSHANRATSRAIEQSTKIVGGYRLAELLGEGGMGRVFRALDGQNRAVAIKLLSAKWSSSPDALARFKQEGYIASQINHPNCVFVHRADEDNGIPFIAMELMTGKTLKDLVLEKGPLPYVEAVNLILHCIDGLVEAHALGMIHRDIKPANCYLDDQGVVKIGDFGLARSLVDNAELTQTGAFLGTPLFASPEQVLGQEIDQQTDIYSLSSTLYFLLAGKAPFESPNAAQVIAKIASAEPPTFASLGIKIPAVLEGIILKGLSREKSKRYATLDQMRSDLLPLIAPENEVASIPRRIVASIVDSTCISILSAILFFSVLGLSGSTSYAAISSTITGFGVSFAYYVLQEILFGKTLGKKFVRLKVVQKSMGSRRQRWGKIAIRAFVFLLLVNSGELIVFSFTDTFNELIVVAASFLGQFAGYGLLFTTWWRTDRKQLLHEWVSDTITRMDLPQVNAAQGRMRIPNWKPTFFTDSHLPVSLGRFQILGELSTTDDSKWYVAQDKTLERGIWIHARTKNCPPLSESRRNCVRKSRMRVIESGETETEKWDAYLAPQGAPLSVCLERGESVPWPIARIVFSQLLEESQLPIDERFPEERMHLSRTWIDESGRITFGEAPLAADSVDGEEGYESLFRRVALASLPPRHPFRRKLIGDVAKRAVTVATSELAPLRGLKLLEQLATPNTKNRISIAQFERQFATLGSIPNSMTASGRFTHAAAILVFMVPAIALAFIMASINGIVIHKQLREDARDLVTLSHILKDQTTYQPVIDLWNAEEQKIWLSPERIAQVEEAQTVKTAKAVGSFEQLGRFEKMVLEQIRNGDRSYESAPLPWAISIDGKVINPEVEEPNEEDERTAQPKTRQMVVVNNSRSEGKVGKELLKSMAESLYRFNEKKEIREVTKLIPIGATIAYPIAFLILWTGFLRGGVIQHFTGVSVLRKDGCRVGVLRHLWRATVFYAPFLLLAYGFQYIQPMGSDGFWWMYQLRSLLVIVPIAYCISTFLWPQKAPHDLLSATTMVPR